jgi:HSP20 family protein
MAQHPVHRGNPDANVATRRNRHPLDLFRRQFDDLFDRMWGGMLAPSGWDVGAERGWGFDVDQNDKEVVVRAEMPGFEQNEVDVRLDNDVLTIRAEKEQKEDGRQEYRNFYRAVTLPGVEAEKAQATYRNGVLELHLPRKESANAKRIAVQAGTETGQASAAPKGGKEANAGQAKK